MQNANCRFAICKKAMMKKTSGNSNRRHANKKTNQKSPVEQNALRSVKR
jgi:hypothetical protein